MIARPEGEDVVLVDGIIHRLPGDPRPAPAIAIRGGEVVAVGSADEARSAAPGARSIELDGRTVLPAFVDAHTHFHRAALLRALHLDFEALAPTSLADVLEAVRARAAASSPGAWIQGDSISASRLAEARLPRRDELDAVAAGHPVIIRGIGKHVIAANSTALAAAGIDETTRDPPGGRIERDAEGVPTGILHERAKLRLDTSATDTVVPPASAADRRAALRTGFGWLQAAGIATIHEMVRLPEEVGDLTELHGRGELGVRVRLYYRVHESPLSLEWLTSLGIRSGWGDERLRVAGVKISVDGWCIFGNAAVHEPYLDAAAGTGILRIEPGELRRLVADADAAGLAVAVHAVGARAVDAALDAFEAIRPARGGPHRIEHAHLDVGPEHLRRMRALDLVLSAQPSFLDAYRADWERLLAPERVDAIMALGSARRAGIPVIIDSDVPSGPLGPLRTIAAAVERAAHPQEALTLTEAWRAHTTVPADTLDDRAIGRLEPGRRADLVILEGDPFAPGGRVPTDVAVTLVDGTVAHDPGGLLG